MSDERPLILYTRRHCHLCEDAKRALAPILHAHGLVLLERDVDADPGWAARFGESVPVGEFAGRILFKVRVEPALVDARLRRWRR